MHDDSGCKDAVHRLYEFLDGELTPAARLVIQKHLDECLPCLEAFDFEAEFRQMVAQRCRERVPDALRARVVQALSAEAGPLGMPPSLQLPGTPPPGRSPLDPLV